MAQCIDNLPSERVRVFISSAQSQENGFAWGDVRRRIKDSLKSCVYLNPFIIEDEASATPSNQFFQRQGDLNSIDSLVVSIVLQCHSASHRDIRRLAVRCLAYLVSSDYYDIAIVELNKAAYDSSDYVRNTLLNICKGDILPVELTNSLISILCNDANYSIRHVAEELKG